MIIGYLDIKCITVLPPETQSPLRVNADAMLSFAVAFQWLQPIRGRQHHEFQVCRRVQLRKLQTRPFTNLRREAPLRRTLKKPSRIPVCERSYHETILSRLDMKRKQPHGRADHRARHLELSFPSQKTPFPEADTDLDREHDETDQPALIARISAARASTGITGGSPLFLTGSLRR